MVRNAKAVCCASSCPTSGGQLIVGAVHKAIVQRAVYEFGRHDILVNNAALLMSRQSLDEISDDEWRHPLRRGPASPAK